MREILFRGKSKGEWIEGSLIVKYDVDACCATDECYIVELCDFAISGYDNTRIFDISPIEVACNTLGQYTGLTDKHGKKIFEGDILDTPDRLIQVVWLKGNAQFDLKFVRYAHDKIITNFKGIEMRDLCSYEIVGNIHDNPELLEKT